MGHRFVSQLVDQDSVDDVFLASDKQLRPNRAGNLYLQVELSDRTGSISARLWNATDRIYGSFENGDFVRVRGSTQVYQGAIQMIAKSIAKASPDEVEEEDFLTLTSQDAERLSARLSELLRGMNDPHLLNLAECFLADDVLMRKFAKAPAGVKNHHAYHGGLLEHVVNLMEMVAAIESLYPDLDRDLLLTGCFLHDLGKVDELSYERGFAYTDEGQLVGHLVMAVGMLDEKVAEAKRLTGESIPEETVLRLKHMIVSHHGQYEFGSPKLPMTLEAVALHHLDNFDAKVRAFQQLIVDDANAGSHWTQYNHQLGRKLYKGATNNHRPPQSPPSATADQQETNAAS